MGSRIGVLERHPGLGGGFVQPVAEAIAAKAANPHQIDILHIGARLQQRHQPAKGGGLDTVAGRVIGKQVGHVLLQWQ